MAKVKLAITSNRPLKNGEHMIFVQISAHYNTMQVPTGITVLKENWIGSKVVGGKKGDPEAGIKNMRLNQKLSKCEAKILNDPDKIAAMNVRQLKAYLLDDNINQDDFFVYCDKRISEYQNLVRFKSAKTLKNTREKILKYIGREELALVDITPRWLEKFERFCLLNDMGQNGVATYLRYLRSIINDAIDDNLIDNYPFRKFKIKTEKTRNRNLSIDDMQTVRNFRTVEKSLEITKDVFILQFILLGINIKDLFWLRPENTIRERIQYNRSKTGRFYNIKIEPEAKFILDKYKGEKYLLWFADTSLYAGKPHTRKTVLQWKNEESFARMINKNLSKILQIKVTDYFVRHSVASILRELKVSKDDISLALGHSDPEHGVTGIYINEDFETVDLCNRKLIDYLNINKGDLILKLLNGIIKKQSPELPRTLPLNESI